jgi:hypothetical protein
MKTLFIGLSSIIIFLNIGFNLETKNITLTFDSYEDGIYYFSDEEENYFEFEKIDPETLKKFDLKGEKYLAKKFKVTYKEEKATDEDGEEYEIKIIVKLELAK